MGHVIVVTGPPGAGKSTVAERLAALLDSSALVAGDDFFAFLRNGVPPWLESAHRQNTAVVEAAAAATGRLAGHCNVVYDGVVGPWFLRTFLEASGLEQLHYMMLLPPLDDCLERVRTRQGHGFTDLDAARHMWQDFHGADIEPRHVIDDRGRQPAEIARTVADHVNDGKISYP